MRAVLLVLCAGAAAAQVTVPGGTHPAATEAKPARKKPRVKAYQAPYNPNVVVLDAAHGGDEDGADLGGAGSEKDFNLAFAQRLGELLTVRGFTVVATRPTESATLAGDQRAEQANRSRAVACLVLHATTKSRGIHLFTSALTPSTADGRPEGSIVQWDSAQAAWLARSLALANELGSAMNGSRIPISVGRVSVNPLDAMLCPAVAVELSPAKAGEKLTDDGYEQHVAEALATALTAWRQQAQQQIATAQAAADAQARADTNAGAATTAPTKPKPKPALVKPPDEMPLEPQGSEPEKPRKPAPIERRPPQQGDPAPNGGRL